MEFILIAVLIQAIVFGLFCGYIAKEKGRSYEGWFVLGFFFSILAVLALIAIPKADSASNSIDDQERHSPSLTNPQATTPTPPILFEGQREITVPKYQLFLTKLFAIEKNNTLDKFTIGDDVFDDLRAALINADSRYEQQLTGLRVKAAESLARRTNLGHVNVLEKKTVDAAQTEGFLVKLKDLGFIVSAQGLKSWKVVSPFGVAYHNQSGADILRLVELYDK